MSMERAGRILGKLKLPKAVVDPESIARSAWPAAVGKRIAARTRAIRLVRQTLVVECEDAEWQRQLNTLRPQILRKLQGFVGETLVTSIDLRPMTPRMGMQAAESVKLAAFELTPSSGVRDEADRIPDPIFRMLYKQSRRKSIGPVQEPLFAHEPAPKEEIKKKESA
jgi:Dna[CI] antecedent, DciA